MPFFEFALLVGFYPDRSAARTEEFVDCLRRNLATEHIAEVHVFLEEPVDVKAYPVLRDPKARLVHHGRRLTYHDLFAHANRWLPDRRVILANNDIYFDHTLALLEGFNLGGKLLCLSRWDVQSDGSAVFFEHPWSQDAWIFQTPLPSFPSDWHLGLPGCENRLAYEAGAAGLALENPSRSVRMHHLHLSGVRHDEGRRLTGPVREVEARFIQDYIATSPPRPTSELGADACAEVTFSETMGYLIERLLPGVSSHCNTLRPFRAVPGPLLGKWFTQVVASRVSPVVVEFRTSGTLFVLCGTEWDGGQAMIRQLASLGHRTAIIPLPTAANTSFEVFSLHGAAGDRVTFPTQVMLVAKRLSRAGESSGRERQAPHPEGPANSHACVLVSAARPGCGMFSMFFQVLGHLQLAERDGLIPVVYLNRHVCYWDDAGQNGARNAWEYSFLPVFGLGIEDIYPDPVALEALDAPTLQRKLADRAVVRADYLSEDIGYGGRINNRQREISASLVERYIHPRREVRSQVDDYFAREFAGRAVIGVHYRGTDKIGEAIPPSFDRYKALVDAQISTRPELRVFVATDCGRFLDRMKTTYGDRVIHTSARRSHDGRPTHFGYGLGAREVVVDALLLSRTSHLLHGTSNVSAAALVFNGKLPHTDLGL